MTAFLELGLRNAAMATALAVIVAIVTRIVRRPALAHALWLLVLLRLVMPPIWNVPIRIPGLDEVRGGTGTSFVAAGFSPRENLSRGLKPAATEDSGKPPDQEYEDPDIVGDEIQLSPPPTPASPTIRDPQSDIRNGIACLSLIGTIAWFAGTIVAVRRFNRLLRFARPAMAALQQEVRDLAHRLGLANAPGLWLVPGAVSPMLWAVGRARLLFPADLLYQLDATQRATLFAHELAHYRRRDHWLRWLEVLVLGLYWWHPVAWWARRELREAEEQCCDAWVTWALATDRAYATALVQTITFLSHARDPLPAAASGLGHIRNLRRRLTMIMRGTTPKSLSWLGLLAVLAIGGFWLTLAPAQSARPKIAGEEEEQVRSQDEIDRKIAEVQKMLRELEEQRGRPGGRTEKKASDEDIAKARRLVEEHAKQMEAKQKEWRSAQEDYRKALDNLGRLGGHEAAEEFSRRYSAAEANAFYRRPATAVNIAPRPATVLAPQPLPPARGLREPIPAGTAPRAVPALPGTQAIQPMKAPAGDAESTARAIDRLSQQLERLAKDVDELRRSMRRESREPQSR
jgi:beta-lactamase regulating signal transducer with metallopeptidase domain